MSRGGGPPEKSSSLPACLGPYILKGPSDQKLPPIQRSEPSSSPPPPLGAYRQRNRVHSIESLGPVSDSFRRSDESHIHRSRLANDPFHRSRYPDERNSSVPHGNVASYSGNAEYSRTTSTVSRVGSHDSLPLPRDTVAVPQRSRTWLEGEAELINHGRSANLSAPSQSLQKEDPISRQAGPSNPKRRYSPPELDGRETQPILRGGKVGSPNIKHRIVPLPRRDGRHLSLDEDPAHTLPSQTSLVQQQGSLWPSYNESLGPDVEAGDTGLPPFRFTYDDDRSTQEPSSKRHASVYQSVKRDLPADRKIPKAAVACEFCKRRKLRCSSMKPCNNCSGRHDCVVLPPKRRGPGKAKKNAPKGKPSKHDKSKGPSSKALSEPPADMQTRRDFAPELGGEVNGLNWPFAPPPDLSPLSLLSQLGPLGPSTSSRHTECYSAEGDSAESRGSGEEDR